MKKRVFLLAILLLIGYMAFEFITEGARQLLGNDRIQVLGEASKAEYQTIEIAKDQVYQGDLLLVNKENPVHKVGVKQDVITLIENAELINGYHLLDPTIAVSESVVKKFVQMIQAAERDGVSNFVINSGYRDMEEQERLYAELGPEIAMPGGYSEHNVGSSLDIGSTQMKMEHAPEGKWLEKNSWKYGFILRYPKDKVAITGTVYEPWHFRYVGLPHSAIMKMNNFTLEEYLEHLAQQRSLSIPIDGRTYEITYYPVEEEMKIKVPIQSDYMISGDNMGGVIITSYVDKVEME